MRPQVRARSLGLLGSLGLLLLGCVEESPSPADDTLTGTPGETTTATGPGGDTDGSGGSTGSDTADETGSAEASTGNDTAPPVDCQEPQPLPPAPVDCSGAEGVITTSVIIEEGGDDPSILEGVRRVEGSIRINRIDATNLDFMACVEEVTGDVTIFGNEQLTNVDGLWSLRELGTDFVLSENSALVDFDGLPNVIEIPRNLVIKNNEVLQTLSGFEQLEEVENLLVQSNPALRSVDGLGGLRTVGNVLAITSNPSLCISSVNCVGLGITDPAVPPATWSAQANDDGC